MPVPAPLRKQAFLTAEQPTGSPSRGGGDNSVAVQEAFIIHPLFHKPDSAVGLLLTVPAKGATGGSSHKQGRRRAKHAANHQAWPATGLVTAPVLTPGPGLSDFSGGW